MFGVLHHPILIHDKGGAGAGGSESKKIIQQHSIVGSGLFVQITRQGNADIFLLRPGFLCKGAVHANADHISIEVAVLTQASGDIT